MKILTSEENTNTATASATVNIISDEVKYGEGIKVVQTREPEPEKNIYKLIADAYKNNPIRIKDLVMMKGNDLCQLIKDLTGAKEVEIIAEIEGVCCFTKDKYSLIKNIICINENGERYDFEINYNKEYRLLKDYNICLEFIYDDEI